MKTQIIALDQQEDYLSVIDKLNWSQTGRVLLTWPGKQPILRRLDLVLVRRHSNQRGVQLGLVTQNGEIRAWAHELRIPVFESTTEAQARRWRVTTRSGNTRRRRLLREKRISPAELSAMRELAHPAKPEWLGKPITRWGFFSLAILALLAVVLYTLPSAKLSLSPVVHWQSLTIPVSASSNIRQVNLSGRLPTYPVSVIVEARGSRTATGSVLVPFKTASGNIKFTNLTEEAIDIPIGTVVSTLDTPPVRFATTKAGKAPAGAGKSTSLSAVAVSPGAAGNLPADSLVAVEGQLGLSLSATNSFATHGGSDGAISSPSEADRMALLVELTEVLGQSAREEMQASMPQGDLALTPSLAYERTLEVTYTPEVGQPGEQIEMTLRLEFTGQAVAYTDLQTLVTPPLDAALPQGFVAQPDSLQIKLYSTPLKNAQGEVTFSILAKRYVQAELPAANAVAHVLGKRQAEATQSLLEALPLASTPQIEVSPAWWPRLPLAAFRIQVQTGEAQ